MALHENEELGAAVSNRQILDSQLKENEVVLQVSCGGGVCQHPQELELLQADSSVYKLVGSVLLSQERDEALSNVSKRVEFIKNEMYSFAPDIFPSLTGVAGKG